MSATSDALDTPVMRQYLEIKRAYPDCILFFRMGDFYEMFLDDAVRAAPVLDVALTRRQNSIPMAGVPYHSMDTYLARLITAGLRVAIAEQTQDPENPKLMKRVVSRVVSKGTVIEEALLPDSSHSWIAALVPGLSRTGVALADVATGDFFACEIDPADAESFLAAREVREILCTAENRASVSFAGLPAPHVLEEWKGSLDEGARQIEQAFRVRPPLLGFPEDSPALAAVSLVTHYLSACFPGQPLPVPAPVFRILDGETVLLDEETIRNLELLESARGGEERTLYSVLNRCATAAGRRRLREILIAPLAARERILKRLDAVGHFLSNSSERAALQKSLAGVRDLERILTRLARGRGSPQDFRSVERAVRVLAALKSAQADIAIAAFGGQAEEDLRELADEIDRTVVQDPPAVPGTELFVKRGVRTDLDTAASARQEGAQWILDYEEQEKSSAKLPLKVKYNRVHGYYIEVTKSNTGSVPAHFKRRQTLLSAERYTTERLSELEEKIQGADLIIERAEKEEFERLQELVLSKADGIKKLMSALAALDTAQALAETAAKFKWIRPEPSGGSELAIEAGRHPVVEAHLTAGEFFTPNSVTMDPAHTLAVLTGPNMAGKSTFIRQTALIQLLMQIGSFVPAARAVLPVADGIYTRIGASDNLSRGESTFFVEMLETSRILRRATARSLVILDEVGRGTSTYDGLSIAWAIVEALTGESRPFVLFATHYHELTALENRPGVFNLTMDVREIDGRIHFLRKVREGAADRSYGIHVAELAGLPDAVIRRAKEKLAELEQKARKTRTVKLTQDADYTLFKDSG